MCRVAEICRNFLLIISAEWIVGVVNIVLAGKEVDFLAPQLPYSGDTAPDWLLVVAAYQCQAYVWVAANTDIGILDQVHYLVGMHLVIRGQGLAVAGGNPPMIVFSQCFYSQIFQASAVRVRGVIDQQVDVLVVFLGKLKAEIYVSANIFIQMFMPGETDDDICPHLHPFFHEILGARFRYKLGADSYITKPYTRNQIIQGLKLVLASRPNILNDSLHAHAVEFLRVCYQLTNRTKDLAGQFAAQEDLSINQWLYQGLESRIKKEENRSGNLRIAPEWQYVFRGWGVDFHDSKTGEQLSLAIGPGGRCDTFDEWRIQSYIETQAERKGAVNEIKPIIKSHSDATEKFIEHLVSQGWIERAKAQSDSLSDQSIETQLEDRWMISEKGIERLSQT